MVPASPQMPIAELRRLMARTHSNGIYESKTLPFGIDAIDALLPSGGLARGAVHEITEQGSDGARASLSALFVAGILARLPGPVIWCLHSRDLFAPALARVGLHPDRVIYCETWKDAEVLPAMEEGLRHGGLAGVGDRTFLKRGNCRTRPRVGSARRLAGRGVAAQYQDCR